LLLLLASGPDRPGRRWRFAQRQAAAPAAARVAGALDPRRRHIIYA